jgi:TPP-dependent pyruvate/acetoin dehydrogenase alpha subunit
MKERLLRDGNAADQELAALDAKAERVIQEAVAFAEASPEPLLDTVEQDVYA